MRNLSDSIASRDYRLDFFRGLALLIIFINHMPLNSFAAWSPSRFGFSDAADLFVFLSGCTAALVYTKSFARFGARVGTGQILYRCGELYITHMRLFFLLALTCALGNVFFHQVDYIGRLNLSYYFNHTQDALPALATLRYVPNYLDILPLYIAILAMVPLVLLAARAHVQLALGLPVMIYLLARLTGLELPADPQSGRSWFFNPFCWQLAFFSGFAIYARWVPVPAPNRVLFYACAVLLLLAIPLSHEPTYRTLPWLAGVRNGLDPYVDKSHFGLLRWLHLMMLVYAVNYLLRNRLAMLKHGLPKLIGRIGQQALPMFQTVSVLSFAAGMFLDRLGASTASLIAVNLGGCLLLIVLAGVLRRLKDKPWQQPVPALAGSVAG